MTRKTRLLFPLIGALLLPTLISDQALAYGPGYGPRAPRPQYLSRHRFHGYVGGQLMGMAMMQQSLGGSDVGRVGPGGGFGLFGGLRFGPYVALEVNWAFTAHDESWEEAGGTVIGADLLNIQTITADLKLHFPTYGMFEPFAQVGLGFAFLGVTGDYYNDGYILQSGATWALGGGGDLWVSPFFSVGGRILYRGIYFSESEYGSLDPDANQIHGLSFDVNLALHF